MDRKYNMQHHQQLSQQQKQQQQQPQPQHLISFDYSNKTINNKFLPDMYLPISATGTMNQTVSTQHVATHHQYHNLSNYNLFNSPHHHPYSNIDYYRQQQQLQQQHLQLVQEEQDRKLEYIYRMNQQYPMPSDIDRNISSTTPPSANVFDTVPSAAAKTCTNIISPSTSTTSITSPLLRVPVVSSSMIREEECQRIRMLQNYQQYNQHQWNQTAVMVQRQLFPYQQKPVLNSNTNVTIISPQYCTYHHLQSNNNNNGVINNSDRLSRVANQMYHQDSHECHNSTPSGMTTNQKQVITAQTTTSAIVSPESYIHRTLRKSEMALCNRHRDNNAYTASQGAVNVVPKFQEKSPKRPTGSYSRCTIVLPTKEEFPSWLQQRKEKWRTLYKVYKIESDCNTPSSLSSPNRKRKRTSTITEDNNDYKDRYDHVSTDFWSNQGYSTFQHWLNKRKTQWNLNYSWNKCKRQQLQQDCFEIDVHLGSGSCFDTLATTGSSDCDSRNKPLLCTNSNSTEYLLATSSNTFNEWLRVRKNQWKVLRRKRQRQRLILSQQKRQPISEPLVANAAGMPPDGFRNGDESESATMIRPSMMQSDMLYIDELLEEQEHNEQLALEQARSRKILDISFIFDSELGCPDDVIVHLIGYLPSNEHWKLLAINKQHRTNIIKRDDVWQQLCPKHWSLPRRPRKSWYEIYITKLNDEMVQYEKIWDDLLVSISSILSKGDCLLQIEKAIQKSEQKYNKSNNKVQHKFDINYVSGVVCERNSILNLAIIHRRHKVSKWLIEIMNADIESCDRGNFTALLNAAYNGDKYLVRLLLQHGADRRKLGTSHYTKGLAPANFIGYTAQQWAEQRGYTDVANLIRMGI